MAGLVSTCRAFAFGVVGLHSVHGTIEENLFREFSFVVSTGRTHERATIFIEPIRLLFRRT